MQQTSRTIWSKISSSYFTISVSSVVLSTIERLYIILSISFLSVVTDLRISVGIFITLICSTQFICNRPDKIYFCRYVNRSIVPHYIYFIIHFLFFAYIISIFFSKLNQYKLYHKFYKMSSIEMKFSILLPDWHYI